jgi:hypothetical protein
MAREWKKELALAIGYEIPEIFVRFNIGSSNAHCVNLL